MVVGFGCDVASLAEFTLTSFYRIEATGGLAQRVLTLVSLGMKSPPQKVIGIMLCYIRFDYCFPQNGYPFFFEYTLYLSVIYRFTDRFFTLLIESLEVFYDSYTLGLSS